VYYGANWGPASSLLDSDFFGGSLRLGGDSLLWSYGTLGRSNSLLSRSDLHKIIIEFKKCQMSARKLTVFLGGATVFFGGATVFLAGATVFFAGATVFLAGGATVFFEGAIYENQNSSAL